MKILLIDDEDVMLDLLNGALTQFGHDVQTACNGKEALDLFLKSPNDINLILTDIKMPVMDGTELTDKIREKGYKTPVILMTGHYSQVDNEEKYLGILHKPFGIDKIRKLVDQVDCPDK